MTGYTAATFHIDLDDDGGTDLSCTFSGLTLDEIKDPTEFEDSSLLWFV